jgi:hypothetical protein
VDLAQRPTIDELTLAEDPARWVALGFSVRAGECLLGTVRLRFVAAAAADDGGLTSWSLRAIASTELDGLPTTLSHGPLREGGAAHPNGALGIDHVVVLSGDFERTTAALASAGLELRRVRETQAPAAVDAAASSDSAAPERIIIRQGFYRLGEALLELVEAPGRAGPASFWGLVVVVEDLERCAADLGEALGGIRDAVQPGRRIATVRSGVGLGPALALMTPDPRATVTAPQPA